jgi:hypothetical protein
MFFQASRQAGPSKKMDEKYEKLALYSWTWAIYDQLTIKSAQCSLEVYSTVETRPNMCVSLPYTFLIFILC